jgi:hypothetical protein
MVCLYDEVGSNFGDIMRVWRDVMKDEQVVKSPVDISSLPRKPHFMPNYPLDIECVSHLRFLTLGFHTTSANRGHCAPAELNCFQHLFTKLNFMPCRHEAKQAVFNLFLR